jgi:hypothetical protein
MSRVRKFHETLAVYRQHGWRLARVLMTAEALGELRGASEAAEARFEGVEPQESAVDAMWFTRAAEGGREAWELRQVGEPYALFEMFEQDEEEEDREDVRREMEVRLHERLTPRAEGDGA